MFWVWEEGHSNWTATDSAASAIPITNGYVYKGSASPQEIPYGSTTNYRVWVWRNGSWGQGQVLNSIALQSLLCDMQPGNMLAVSRR